MTDKRLSTGQIHDLCFKYWKLETGDGRIMLPCKGKFCKGALFNAATTTWHADHEIVRAHGGSDYPPNVRPLCKACHAEKTAKVDIPAIAKGKRQTKSVYGIKRRSGFRRPHGAVYDWSRGRYVRPTDVETDETECASTSEEIAP